jgi:hypothetical protein
MSDMTTLRQQLFDQLQELRNTDQANADAIALATKKAAAVSQLAGTIVETVKVEVDYLRLTGGGESSFLDTAVGQSNLPPGITTSVVHRLKG